MRSGCEWGNLSAQSHTFSVSARTCGCCLRRDREDEAFDVLRRIPDARFALLVDLRQQVERGGVAVLPQRFGVADEPVEAVLVLPAQLLARARARAGVHDGCDVAQPDAEPRDGAEFG